MKLIDINNTLYNVDKIIGITSPAFDEDDKTWYFITYIQDGIEEVVEDTDAQNIMNERTRIVLELKNDRSESNL